MDEAGKGPVMGPMVVAAVSVENAKLVENLGFKDSKLLSSQRRLKLFNLIKQNYSYEIEIINVEKIDEYRMKNQLNLLNRKAFEKVISKLNPNVAYVDAADVNEERFGREIKINLTNPNDTDVISMHKADSMIPVVAAASIIAKQTRELEIKKLKKEIGDFGSGYPSDERTIKFLKSYFHDNSRWPPGTRKSWKTIERIRPVVKLSDFGD
ncbi:MAG: ribonuclease HII [Candidatus Thermoplasmatota archaeon]|nr:ribonuclease HII [Candidatus Thermoplasmatota archaeon]MEC7350192.1 ribonuclease HII [Candidatus Thermoplasmatota archaeon]MEC7494268.1 ribonuclease HII [Candidatus Thermoplasmatota archaeon]MEC7976671.1 ribonuclease HII [Candidatus Thermoplasmatota archaeon]MEC8217130.1 ribonuclease HII [Candidatus Thermoplasmatota archaeon]